MRGPLPLDDHDFAAIRAQVMAKIETPRRAPVWRYAFATMALAVMVFSVYIGRQPMVAPPSSAASPHLLPPTREKEAVVAVAAPPAPPLPRAGEGAAKRRVRVARRAKPAPQQVARIELQTADPDVRIIWITN